MHVCLIFQINKNDIIIQNIPLYDITEATTNKTKKNFASTKIKLNLLKIIEIDYPLFVSGYDHKT